MIVPSLVRLPDRIVKPDVSPKMYNAYGVCYNVLFVVVYVVYGFFCRLSSVPNGRNDQSTSRHV